MATVWRGGKIVYWAAPWWRRVLYRLGVTAHHARLGDVKRAAAMEGASGTIYAGLIGYFSQLGVVDGKPYKRGWWCRAAPTGWYCTRENGHYGPCAAREIPGLKAWARRFLLSMRGGR